MQSYVLYVNVFKFVTLDIKMSWKKGKYHFKVNLNKTEIYYTHDITFFAWKSLQQTEQDAEWKSQERSAPMT